MRVCLQNFPVCVTSQLVAQTTKESDYSFTVEFTAHKCTSTEENKMALACEKEDRIGFSFFVRCFVCASFLSSFSFFSFLSDSYCRENHWKTSTHAIFGFQNKIRSGWSTKSMETGLFEEQKSRFHLKNNERSAKKGRRWRIAKPIGLD